MRFTTIMTSAFALALSVSVAFSGTASANEFEGALKETAKTKIATWLSDATVIDAVKAQNAKNAGLTQADIDALDKKWRAGDQAMIDGVLGNALSAFLASQKEASGGLFTEIFVMDNKGLNVGQSDVTSDYWQGDEGKWQNTYAKGAGAMDISEVEEDESSQTFQSQVSMTVVDGSGAAIGAVTVGVDVGQLGQ